MRRLGPESCPMLSNWNYEGMSYTMLKKTVQQGRSERRPEAYPLGYVEDLSDARTMLAGFFSIVSGDVVENGRLNRWQWRGLAGRTWKNER
jgi:hypothetical protein